MHIDKNLHRNAVPITLPAAFAGLDLGLSQTPAAQSFYSTWVKRILDVTAILICLPLILPVMMVLTLVVAAQGGNPFYRQYRVGLNGKTFTMWKLRSMVPNADAALATYLQSNPAARAEWAHTQKLKNDPRITPVGRILRRTSLDELPQLLNVLKGEMSLVGPRPMLPEQQGMYPGTAYYAMLPGITGLWQISARNEAAFAERAFFDSRYYATLSFMTDLKTLLATVRVVTRATGH
jgi:lipopolysaccharide/colanic/teichoic acid biosynthesis glycosyltransferase